MDPELVKILVYKSLHFVGAVALMAALGALFAGEHPATRKLGGILHGVALLLILVAGFGLLARLHANTFHWWVIAKLVIWLALGALLALAKRKVIPAPAGILATIALGATAALLGIWFGSPA